MMILDVSERDLVRVSKIVGGGKVDLGLSPILPIRAEFKNGAFHVPSRVKFSIPDDTLFLIHPSGDVLVQGSTRSYLGFLWEHLPEERQMAELLRYQAIHGMIFEKPTTDRVTTNLIWSQLSWAGDILTTAHLAINLSPWNFQPGQGPCYISTLSEAGIEEAILRNYPIHPDLLARHGHAQLLRGMISTLDPEAIVGEGCRPDRGEYVLNYTPSCFDGRIRLSNGLLNAGYVISDIDRDVEEGSERQYWVSPVRVSLNYFPEQAR